MLLAELVFLGGLMLLRDLLLLRGLGQGPCARPIGHLWPFVAYCKLLSDHSRSSIVQLVTVQETGPRTKHVRDAGEKTTNDTLP